MTAVNALNTVYHWVLQALAGTTYPIEREYTAELLGFEAVCENSLDAVSDRDFGIEFNAAASLIMMHLSRMSEEMILWTSAQFKFVNIPDRFCTGSSIMPQKKKSRCSRTYSCKNWSCLWRLNESFDPDERSTFSI